MPREGQFSPEERAELLALRRRLGVSFGEMSHETGIGEATLRMWERRSRVVSAPRFVELEVSATGAACVFEVELAGGKRVRVPPDFDRAALRRLLEALEDPC